METTKKQLIECKSDEILDYDTLFVPQIVIENLPYVKYVINIQRKIRIIFLRNLEFVRRKN